jgi:hypothetical protein
MEQQYPPLLLGSQAAPTPATVLFPVLAVALDIVLIFYCLDDLSRRAIVAGGNKQLWAAIIILGGPVGQVCYWLYGRGPN